METLYSLAQVAEYFGISKNTLRKWILDKKVDYLKIGHSIRFSEGQVKTMMENRSRD